MQGLRELEFDREMGKLSDADYESMHKALEDRALTAMAAVENIRGRPTRPRTRRSRASHLWRRRPTSRASARASIRYRLSSCTPNHRARRNRRQPHRQRSQQD